MTNKTILALVVAKNENKKLLRRIKREDEEIDEVELRERGKKCKDMEISSGAFGIIGDIFSDIGEVLGAIPVIGDIAKGAASVVAGVTHLVKNGIDMGSTVLDCDQVPFDEIKVLINKKFNEVNRKLDKMAEILGEISEKVSITLTKVEAARKEMKQGFKDVKDTIKNIDFNNKISAINDFIDYYEAEMKRIKGLPKEKYLRDLLNEEFNILEQLREIEKPDQLREPLYQLISAVNYSLDKGENKVPLFVLEAIIKGAQTYAFVMLFLLEQHANLADYHYEMGKSENFNNQLDIIEKVFQTFSQFLISKRNSLFKNVIDILVKILGKQEYSNKDKSLIGNQISSLTDLKRKIEEIKLSFIRELPKNDIQISFDYGISEPGRDWKRERQVEYAVQFKIGNMYSRISDWKPFEIEGVGNPSLRISIDQFRDRLIFRKLDKNIVELVGIIPRGGTDLRDISRDLYNAAGNPTEQVAIDEVTLYMKNGADVNAVFENGRSAIHAAAQAGHVSVVELLLRNKVDKDKKDDKGYTPLHLAAEAGKEFIVSLLIENKADIDAKTYGELLTPLHIASRKGFLDCVNNLLSRDTVNVKDKFGFTPLHSAISGGDKVVTAFVENEKEYHTDINAYSNKEQLTPIHLAVLNGDLNLIQALMASKNIDLNARDWNGLTPLHYAALARASNNNLKIAKELLKAKEKINPNIPTKNNWTPLHFALYNRNTDVALELLKVKNIDLSLCTDRGLTVLHLSTATGQTQVIRELLKSKIDTEETDELTNKTDELLKTKIDTEAKTDEGYTALHIGAMRIEPEIVPMLVENCFSVESSYANDGSTPLHLAAAAGRGTNALYFINCNEWNRRRRDFAGRMPIHVAVLRGHLEVVEILIEDFQTVYIKDFHDKTPFDIAVEYLYTDIIKLFVNKGLQLNRWYGDGRPPLSIFAQLGNLEMVEFLINKGANPSDRGFDNKNFFDLAAENGHTNILEYAIKNKKVDSSIIEPSVYRAIDCDQLDSIKYFATLKNTASNIELGAALQYASSEGKLRIVKYLIEDVAISVDEEIDENSSQKFVPPLSKTALCNAVKNGHNQLVLYLISQLANPFIDCAYGEKKYTALVYAARNKNSEIFKLFVEKDPNKLDVFGNRPLYYAAMFGCLDCAKYLIEKRRVDINAKNSNDDTALHAAYDSVHSDMWNFLEYKGANFDAKNKDGDIPQQKLINNMKNPDSSNYNNYGYRLRRNVDSFSRINSTKKLDSPTNPKYAPIKSYVNSAMEIFQKKHAQEKMLLIDHDSKMAGYSGFKNIDVNATLLLFDILLRKITKEKYKPMLNERMTEMDAKADALRITEAIENFITSSTDPQSAKRIDFSEVHSNVFKALMSGKGNKIPVILHELLKNI